MKNDAGHYEKIYRPMTPEDIKYMQKYLNFLENDMISVSSEDISLTEPEESTEKQVLEINARTKKLNERYLMIELGKYFPEVKETKLYRVINNG